MEAERKPNGTDTAVVPKPRRARRVEQTPRYSESDDLTPSEEMFARWLGEHSAVNRISADEEAKVVVICFGAPLSGNALKFIKRKPAFRKVLEDARIVAAELHMRTAKRRALQITPRAIKTYGKAIQKLDEALDGDDSLAALRTASGLLTPFLDRTIPKRTETSNVNTHVSITLTPEQAVGFNAPILTVEAEEVKRLPDTTT